MNTMRSLALLLGCASVWCAAADTQAPDPASGRNERTSISAMRNSDVELSMTMEKISNDGLTRAPAEDLHPGDRVVICFQAGASGFVTVWHHDLAKTERLIYPNNRSHPNNDRAEPVAGGKRYCVGDPASKFALVVEPSVAEQRVYVHWTRELSQAVSRNALLRLDSGPSQESTTEVTQVLVYKAR